jgi:hypothetical protein
MMHDNSRRRSESPVAIRYWQGHWSSKVDTHDATNVSPLFGFKPRRRIQTPDCGGKDQVNSYQHTRSVVNLERVGKEESKGIVGARMGSKEQEQIMARRSDTQGHQYGVPHRICTCIEAHNTRYHGSRSVTLMLYSSRGGGSTKYAANMLFNRPMKWLRNTAWKTMEYCWTKECASIRSECLCICQIGTNFHQDRELTRQ